MANDILQTIVAQKKREVETARKRLGEQDLCDLAMQLKIKRGFIQAIANSGPDQIGVIAEVKRASPSKGTINPHLNPADYAAACERGGAVALSVLTDQSFFQGSLDDLTSARQSIRLPVLRKDFLISAYQIYESAVAGADAVLLIVRILSQQQLVDYLGLCSELGLDALVEVHTEQDLETASTAGARLIGINNRNLKTFETDVGTAVSMVGRLEEGQIPVAASGIQSRRDIDRNLNAGIYNFLIGESIARAANPETFVSSLI